MFKKMTSILLILTILGIPEAMASKIQQQGIVKHADCNSRGVSDANCIPTTDQVYDTTNGQLLTNSISGGLLGGGGGGAAIELLTNTGFESGLSGYTASGGTTNTVTSGSNLIAGAKTASWQASASSQTFASSAMTIKGLAGGQCSAQIYYLYGGTSGDYTFEVIDGSSNVLASSSLGAQALASTPAILSFPCGGSTASTLTWQVVSNVASPSTIYMDTLHLGSLTIQQVSQAQLVGTAAWSISTNQWTISSAASTFGNFPANGSISSPTVTGQLTAPGTRIPAVVLPSYGAGVYYLVANSCFQDQTTNNTGYWTFSDGTNNGGDNGAQNGANASFGSVVSTISEATSGSNLTFQIQGRTTGSGQPISIGCGGANGTLNISVYYFPSTTTSTVSVGQQPQSGEAYFNPGSSWSNSNTSANFTDFSGSSAGFTQSSNKGITLTAASGTLPGVTWTPSSAATYLVCANSSFSAGSGTVNAGVALTDGSGNVIVTESILSVTTTVASAFSVCGIYVATSTAPQTVKLQGNVNGNSLNTNYFGATSNTRVGVVDFTIVNISASIGSAQFNGPGTFTSTAGTSAYHHEFISFGGSGSSGARTICTSGPCTVYASSMPGATVNRSATSHYQINIPAGVFSGGYSVTMTCTHLDDGQALVGGIGSTMPTTSVYDFFTLQGGSAVDGQCDVSLDGAR